jgi:hypothetical protein
VVKFRKLSIHKFTVFKFCLIAIHRRQLLPPCPCYFHILIVCSIYSLYTCYIPTHDVHCLYRHSADVVWAQLKFKQNMKRTLRLKALVLSLSYGLLFPLDLNFPNCGRWAQFRWSVEQLWLINYMGLYNETNRSTHRNIFKVPRYV